MLDELAQNGYTILPRVFSEQETAALADQLAAALADPNEPAVLRSRGRTYGARNLLHSFPQVVELARRTALRELVAAALGPRAGIVRGLFFDKPPDRSWSLPWHRDRTIAVKSSHPPSDHFSKATFKAGVPHVEAPVWLLEQMLTLRIHLDPMTEENGPLSVIPGSHVADGELSRGDRPSVVTLHTGAGDVLAMRPLLSHASGMSQPGTTAHRRVIHLELAPSAELPDRYEWHDFVVVAKGRSVAKRGQTR